jgi:hypothetical protein
VAQAPDFQWRLRYWGRAMQTMANSGGRCERRLSSAATAPSFYGGRRIVGFVKSGQLFKMAGGCRVTGEMTIQSSVGSVQIDIQDALLSRDKDSITGMGIDSANLVFTFKAERIR